MHGKYVIERMNQDEVQTAVSWAAQEGWNPGLNDAKCFYQTDPRGFFAGKLDGKIIAVGSAVVYDKNFAFCGFYIVDKAYRGKGYGLTLTKARLAYAGQRNVGIDGVLDMVDKYARLGYRTAHHNARYQGSKVYPVKPNENLLPLELVDFEQLKAFDRRHFPAKRDRFLSCWINQPGGYSIAYTHKNILKGYGVIRPCIQGFKIGPLFAEEPEIADILFKQLTQFANGQIYFLDIPENNPNALNLIQHHAFEKSFETARMYLKGPPDIELSNIYGITSFELG